MLEGEEEKKLTHETEMVASTIIGGPNTSEAPASIPFMLLRTVLEALFADVNRLGQPRMPTYFFNARSNR